jgi:hypothetical protein
MVVELALTPTAFVPAFVQVLYLNFIYQPLPIRPAAKGLARGRRPHRERASTTSER